MSTAEPVLLLFYQNLRKNMAWWKRHAPPSTLKLIRHGVQPDFPLPDFLASKPQMKTKKENQEALKVLEEYLEVKAVIKNPQGPIRHTIPWFVINKQENGGGKVKINSRLQNIEQIHGSKAFQTGSLEKYFSSFAKRHVVWENRFKTCLLSPGVITNPEGICKSPSGRRYIPVSGSSLWLKPPPPKVDEGNAHFLQNMEKKRNNLFHLFGRHFGGEQHPPRGGKGFEGNAPNPEESRHGGQLEKEYLGAKTKSRQFGVYHKLGRGAFGGPKSKIKTVRREMGKLLNKSEMTCRKMAAILGNLRSFLVAMPP